jgi:hypothetical protein
MAFPLRSGRQPVLLLYTRFENHRIAGLAQWAAAGFAPVPVNQLRITWKKSTMELAKSFNIAACEAYEYLRYFYG